MNYEKILYYGAYHHLMVMKLQGAAQKEKQKHKRKTALYHRLNDAVAYHEGKRDAYAIMLDILSGREHLYELPNRGKVRASHKSFDDIKNHSRKYELERRPLTYLTSLYMNDEFDMIEKEQ